MRRDANRTSRQPLRLGLGLVLAATAAYGLPGPVARAAEPSPTEPTLQRYSSQILTWRPCQALQCAELTVPRDYDDPAAGDISISLTRATAKTASPLGSIVVNPGGPGGSGVDFTGYVATSVMPSVAAKFNVVGFDPRGVGRSAPITCMTGRQTTAWLRTDTTPDTAAEQEVLMRRAATIGTGCLAMSPAMARHVSTEDTVRDLDILRAALGDERLNLLGFSYGTYLGTKYAERFGDRVGRFVLDGAVDPALDVMQVSQGQSAGFQAAFARFAASCAKQAGCPGGRSAASVTAWVNGLLRRLDRSPLPTDQGTTLNQAQAITAIFFAMYSTDTWPSLRAGLADAAAGDGSGLQFLADYATDRTGPNRYGSNMNSAFYAISCWDFPAAPDRAGLQAAARRWSATAAVPELARAMSWGNAPCTTWYGHARQPPAPAVTTTTAPILVVGTRFDPATPYEWAEALHRQLPTSSLLTYEGDGHTAYGSGSNCIDRAIDAYFLTGAMPAPGKSCT